MGKQSQLLLEPTEVQLGLQVGVEFDKITPSLLLKMEQQILQYKYQLFWTGEMLGDPPKLYELLISGLW